MKLVVVCRDELDTMLATTSPHLFPHGEGEGR